jgi:hypothetical protein
VNSHSGKVRCDMNLTAYTEQGDKGKLHNDFHAFFTPSSPNVTQVVKSRRMRWVKHVVRMGWTGVEHIHFWVGWGGGGTDINRPL